MMKKKINNVGKASVPVGDKFYGRNDAIDQISKDDNRFCGSCEEAIRSIDLMLNKSKEIAGPFPFRRL